MPTEVDYSVASSLDFDLVVGAGITGIVRYLGGWGRLQAAERDLALSKGLSIALVWEQGESDALAGAWLGEQHGRQAAAEAEVLFPGGGGCVFLACDTDPRRNRQAVLDYYRAGSPFARAANNRAGGYLGDDPGVELLDEGTLDVLWQPSATSWSAQYPSPRAHLVQRLGQPWDLGGNYDFNDVAGPYGAWGQSASPPPGSLEEALTMYANAAIFCPEYTGGAVFMTNGQTRRYLSSPDEWQNFIDLGLCAPGDAKYVIAPTMAGLVDITTLAANAATAATRPLGDGTGAPPTDFGPLRTAVDNLGAAVDGVKAAIPPA